VKIKPQNTNEDMKLKLTAAQMLQKSRNSSVLHRKVSHHFFHYTVTQRLM